MVARLLASILSGSAFFKIFLGGLRSCTERCGYSSTIDSSAPLGTASWDAVRGFAS